MLHEKEEETMKAPGVCCGGSACWHMFAPSVRVKKPGSCVKHLLWLHILVLLLAGQASCNQTSAPSSLPFLTAANVQTSEVYYHIYVTVDVTGETKNQSEIEAWLCNVFQNDLKTCGFSIDAATTTTPTSPQTTYETTLKTTATTSQTYNTTTAAATIALTNNTTTTATTSTALTNNTTTTAATSTALTNNTTTTAATSTTLTNNTTTTAATSTRLTSDTTTIAPTSTTLIWNNTTTAPTSTTSKSDTTTTAATSTLKSDTTTTAPTSTTLKSDTTTTAPSSTTLKSDTTTTAPTSTTLKSGTTTTAATSTTLKSGTTTTAATSTTLKSGTTTTAATSTTLKSGTTTTAPTSTTLKSGTTTTATTTVAPGQIKSSIASLLGFIENTVTTINKGNNKPLEKPNSNQSNKQRIRREIRDSVAQTSGISNDKTSDSCQEIEISCSQKTAIGQSTCMVTLKLKQNVRPCCILSTLCAASKGSSDIHVVGTKVDRITPLQNECSSDPQKESSCTYTGQTGASCETSGTAYTPGYNSTHCAADKQNNTCCSAYCSGAHAYYSFEMSIQDQTIAIEQLEEQFKKPLECSTSTDDPCPLSSVVSSLKDIYMANEGTTNNWRGILVFSHVVPIREVLEFVMIVLQKIKQITFNNQVTRAAYCGNSTGLAASQYEVITYPKPANVCSTVESSKLNCQGGKNLFVLLNEQYVWPSSTPGPNVTTAQPNATNSSVNVTTAQPNATTSSVNVTSFPLNTTTEAVNATTTPANVTVSATSTTTNESVPLTTESAESQAGGLFEMTKDVSKLNSSQVDQLVSQLESLLSGPTVSLSLGNTSIQIVSNLLGASPETLSDSSERIIGIVDTVGLKLVLDDETQDLLSSDVALSVKPADGTNFQETFFSISDPSKVEVRGDPRPRRSVRKENSSIPQGSIRLPPSLTENLPSEEQQLVSRVQFNFYQKSTVFQDMSLGERILNSGILGASVANLSISSLQDDVLIHLRHTEPIPGNYVASCVFWDFTRNNGSGGWNPRGCTVRNSTDNETICGCNHLTSFAILLDLSREPVISRLQATILTFITYIGCGISAIFLSITLLTYLAFGKLRKDIPSKILIQLCLALLLLNLVFLVDSWLALYPEAVGLCISTAWFLHYFLLVTFTWMGLEAVHMYLALVKVFNSYISRYMLKFSLVGWGVPMIVVIIVIAIDKDNYGLVSYGKFPDGTTDEFCWLKNDIAFYVAVVAYFCVIFAFNFIMFIVVLVQLCRIKRQNPQNALYRTTLQDARSVAGITILLGLTWGFAFFAWGPLNLPFMYLFAIFNSLQGFFIFVFHCAVKENVRKQWRTYLCCGRMRLAENSEWSRTATQKTMKKSSVTRLTSLHSSKSSQSNNSTSSSTFLVSDSSEPVNGIGSPFEDRTITADDEPSRDVILNEINSQCRNRRAP